MTLAETNEKGTDSMNLENLTTDSEENDKQRVLVTGGSGFIGRHVLAYLEKRGYACYSVDLLPCPVPISGEAIEIDMVERQGLSEFIQRVQPQFVIHLAALASFAVDDESLYKNNVLATENLYSSLSDSVRRSIYISTQLVVKMGDDPRDGQHFSPYSSYGETKAEMERSIRQNAPKDWVIARPANIWGPHHPSLGDTIFRYLKKGWYLHPGTREPIVRSYGYVENAAAQIVELVLSDRSVGRVFYISDTPIDSANLMDAFSQEFRQARTRRMPATILKIMGHIGDLIQKTGIDFPLDSGRAFRMTSSYIIPVESTLEITGPPEVPLEEGVKRTALWLKEHWE